MIFRHIRSSSAVTRVFDLSTTSLRRFCTRTPTLSTRKTVTSKAMSAQPPKILVAVIGAGLVGSDLIDQLLSIPANISPFKLVSVSSSSRLLFAGKENPITSEAKTTWKSSLTSSSTPADLKKLTAQLAEWRSGNERVAVVDNTSSEDIAALYPVWLKEGIHVITPNKKAFSGEKDLFDQILVASRESGAKFLNEATVGAGLPVIAPLKELLATGDKVRSDSVVVLLVSDRRLHRLSESRVFSQAQ